MERGVIMGRQDSGEISVHDIAEKVRLPRRADERVTAAESGEWGQKAARQPATAGLR
jgi:hypothetical protein